LPIVIKGKRAALKAAIILCIQKLVTQLRESIMLKDKKVLWVVEYIIGFILLVAVIPLIVHPQPGWSEAHGWAYLLFLISVSIILLSCASAMRQRMQLAERIAELERMTIGLKTAGSRGQGEGKQKRTVGEQFAGSAN